MRSFAGFCLLLLAVLARGDEKDFPKIYNTQEETIPLLKPASVPARIHLPEGFHATLFAGEPDVQQPIAITTDSRGRLWVAENYTYAEHKVNFDTNLHDRIVIFEDSDGSGRFSSRKVFWDKAEKLTSVAVGFGGVFALCPPRLLFIPDKNRDDVPDGKPEVLLDGFDADVIRHTIANGLKWGPDGWLYGRHGIQATSRIGAPGTPNEERIPINVGIWRYHPVTRKFEVVAEGTTNPWGSDWDESGQLFFINTVIGHLWHVVPGAYYRRMYGEHSNPHLYELIDQTADHYHWDTREQWLDVRKGVTSTTSEAGGGHAHSGLMIYLGDNWPAQYRNTVFAVNYHGKRLNNDLLERSGAGYVAHHGHDMMQVDDPWFRGIDLLYGPDGGVYVSDWSDIGECHDNDAIHRTSGRIYKVVYGTPAKWSGDLEKAGNAELVRMQKHSNEWFVRTARRVLQERAVAGQDLSGANRELRELYRTGDVRAQLRALWCLYATGGADEPFLARALSSENENVRVWAILLLTDQKPPSRSVKEKFLEMARKDSSGLVLSFLTAAMHRMPPEERWELAGALAERREFASDRTFPLLLWYQLEPAVASNPARAAELARTTVVPKIRRFVTRRLFEDLDNWSSAADSVVGAAATAGVDYQRAVLQGMAEALHGRQRVKTPGRWPGVSQQLASSADPEIRRLEREVSARFGDERALKELRSVAMDDSAPLGERQTALRTLLQCKAPEPGPVLVKLLDQPELAPEAIRGLAAAGQPESAALLIDRYASLPSNTARAEAMNALVSRTNYALALLEAIQRGRIKRTEVNASQLRQLRTLKDEELKERIASVWPQLDSSPSGKQAQFARLKKLLAPDQIRTANAAHGRQLFQQTCAVCHKLFGEGAQIGPDLTGSDRANVDYLLDNIVDPSGIVPESYRVSNISLKDGRLIAGIVLSRTPQTVTVQTTSEKLSLEPGAIESITESRLSMMPEGLLDAMSDQDVKDLGAYLMSPNPVPLPSGGR